MGLWRIEFDLSSMVNRLFAGSQVTPINDPGTGTSMPWNSLRILTWDNWTLAWGN